MIVHLNGVSSKKRTYTHPKSLKSNYSSSILSKYFALVVDFLV